MKKPIAVPHTCPDIDKVKKIIRKHCPPGSDDRKLAFEILETLRSQNEQLRFNAAYWKRLRGQ